MHEAIAAGREVKTKTPAAEPAVAHQDPYGQLKKALRAKRERHYFGRKMPGKKSTLMALI